MNNKIVISVMIGIAAFGATMYLVQKLPSNAVTDAVKSAATIAQGG